LNAWWEKATIEFKNWAVNSQFPKRSLHKGELSSSDKKSNRELARKRIVGEYVNRKLKIFKILADR
jgi:hypothetical protein